MKFISKFFDILKSKENDISGAKTEKTTIMTAQERLEYLTRVIQGIETEQKVERDDGKEVTWEEHASIKTRLSAIDLMNKMTGEYVQKIEADVNSEVNITIELSEE